ncbi:MAG: NUDIX hydrolase [Thermodesulfobacteriota bacterium]
MIRKYPQHPLIGVGGVIFQDDQVLLIKRGKEPALGQWSIPGGVVGVGETLKEAVVREVREETHLEVEVLNLVKVIERIFREPDGRISYHYVLLDFLCQIKEGELEADSDAQEACFVPLAELNNYSLTSATREVIYRANWMRQNPSKLSPPLEFGPLYD